MTLVDGSEASKIEHAFPDWHQVAGGSAANTAAGVAAIGGAPAFVGAVGCDEPGDWYSSDLVTAGVECHVSRTSSGAPTGVCHVLVTSKGERTMATSLGAAGEIIAGTVDEAGVGRARFVYIEGYLLDAPAASKALDHALDLAKTQGTLVALSLSDPFVVERHGDRIAELVFGGVVDLMFGNEDEALSLTGESSFDGAIDKLRANDALHIVTRGSNGAVGIGPGVDVSVGADPVETVVDTTGAGDLFAAGCLWGLAHDLTVEQALRAGSAAAAEIITHLGARAVRGLDPRLREGGS